jgi:OHCU decarboxylase
MISARPYLVVDEVLAAADAVFDGLTEPDWLEAFAGHPRIGERGDQAANREQSGVDEAKAATLTAITGANRQYEARYGFTYIVYASGKTAEEMLAIAESRLGNSRKQEIDNASSEQRAITATRLRRMLCEGDPK